MKNYAASQTLGERLKRSVARKLRIVSAAATAIGLLTSAATAAQVSLSWQDNSSDEAGFKVERAAGNGAYAQIGTVGVNATTYADTSVLAGTTYNYRVRAYNGAGDSTYSNTATVSVPGGTNQAPTISNIPDQNVTSGGATPLLAFTVGDAETAAASLTVTRSSSNTTLVPNANVVLGGSGANRTVRVTSASGRTGTATITIAVSDGTASSSDTFVVTVSTASAGLPPAIGSITNRTTSTGGQVGPITVSIGDNDSAAGSLTVTGTSSNQTLVPNANIVITGTGTTRSVTVTGAAGQSGVATITLTVSDGTNTRTETFLAAFGAALPASSRLLNLSARVQCRPSSESLIPGFVIAGTPNKNVLLRVVGPSLGASPFNVPGVLPNPRIALKRWTGSAFVDDSANDNWGTNANVTQVRQTANQVSAFPLLEGGGDAALLRSLAAGQYTIIADDPANANGLVLVEIYDADPTNSGSALMNMSNRGYVGAGGDVMIAGFVISPEAAKTLLIRAVGPRLAAAPFNVPNTISDPTFEIFRNNGDGTDTSILVCDNWGDGPDAAQTELISAQVQAFPLVAGSRDAAVVTTLQPGVYTVIVRGVANVTGSALVEVYSIE